MMIKMSQGAVRNNILNSKRVVLHQCNNTSQQFIFHQAKNVYIVALLFQQRRAPATVTKLMVCVISWPEKG